MAYTYADRVKETSTTTGTGTLDLDGATTGFQTFVAGTGAGATVHYLITDGTDWEVGKGDVTDAATDTLSRDAVFASSNSDALVSWSVGDKDVSLVAPAIVFNELRRAVQIAKISDYSSTAADDGGETIPLNTVSGNVDLVLPLEADIENGFEIAAIKTSASNESEIRQHATDGGAIQIRLKALDDYVRLRWTGIVWNIVETRIAPRVTVHTSTGTHTYEEGHSYIVVEVQHGGGAGGGAIAPSAGQVSSGGGGASGAYSRKLILASALGTSDTATIGAGGTGVSASTGGTGGDSAFGTHINDTSKGGLGGAVDGPESKFGGANGGNGQSAGIDGDLNIDGGDGFASWHGGTTEFTNQIAISGAGSPSFFGMGARNIRATGGTVTGITAGVFGSGGSGAASADAVGASSTGGDGAPGVVIVTEYF